MALLFPHRPFSHPFQKPHTFEFPTNPKPTSIPSLPSLPTPNLIRPPFPSLTSSLAKKTLTPPLSSSFPVSETTDFDFSDLGPEEEQEDLAGSPWEGAVVYRRDASAAHVEYCTTLERLGLGKLSSGVSRRRASAMGIRVPARRGKEAPFGDGETPVLVSVDVTRRKRRLKLDGIVRTVITLGCNRCAEPAAEVVFSNFTFLLTEDLAEDSDEFNMGVVYGEDRTKTSTASSTEEEDDEKQIDSDDRLYFPSQEKEIDLSKHIRDIVHVEITINAICDASCRGLCFKCGTNLNKSSCGCSKEEVKDKEFGPLKNLRRQMQQR